MWLIIFLRRNALDKWTYCLEKQLCVSIFQYLQEAWLSVFLGIQNMHITELEACKKHSTQPEKP